MTIKVLPGRFLNAFIGLAGGVFALAGLAPAETIVVAPTQMGSWSFATVDGSGAACIPSTGTCGSGSMVTGPAAPPIGVGSANLQTGPGGGDGGSKIDSSALNGISLGSLTTLSYSTYDTLNNGQQFPYLKLYLTWDGGADSDQIFFEPPYQTPATGNAGLPDQGPTSMNTWQTWNALTGGWWDNNGVCGEGTGVCSLSEFASLLAGNVSLNDITITGGATTPDGDGLSLRVGVASANEDFNGYVDNVTLGVSGTDTTYDFEPAVPASTPEPGTIALFGAGMLLLAAARRKALLGRR
jgi:PEP-CTERM motif